MCATVCFAAQTLTTHAQMPAAVIFILGFVIYRSGRKLKTTAQSHRKWVNNHPLQLNLAHNKPNRNNTFMYKTSDSRGEFNIERVLAEISLSIKC